MTRGHRFSAAIKTRLVAAAISPAEFARRANVTDWIITQVLSGGNCDPHVTDRLCNALANPVTLGASSVANPSNITATGHKFVTGDTVTITGHTGSTPAIDGDRLITVVDGNNFTIPINVTGGGSGGIATLSPTSLGIQRL